MLTSAGSTIKADKVIAGLGIEPNTALAQNAGVEIGNGIVVDQQLRTSAKDVFAAGDVADFYNPLLDKRLRVEHDDNTQEMGRAAGRNMADASEAYDHLPLFYSDLFDLGYEAVGDTRTQLETVTSWEELGRKGIVCYLENERPRGFVFWNVWDMVDKGRDMIRRGEPLDKAGLEKWYKENVG